MKEQGKYFYLNKIIENENNVLHILNGSCMLERFKENDMMRVSDIYIPFNEAMCWGIADEEIFSKAFIEKRYKSLKSTKETYSNIVLEALEPLFNQKFDFITMWFGNDMFCQINMLTMMAYLDQINYKGNLLLCIVSEGDDEFLEEVREVSIEGALDKYKKLVCLKQISKESSSYITYDIAKMYLEYRQETSEISKYIKKHIYRENRLLVETLIKKFRRYGLGDLQYEMMIEECRLQNNCILNNEK